MSDKKPLLSVVIPVYNKGPHVNRSISSVLNQTFGDFELLLINDASTDNSLEEIQKFIDPRIRILHRDQPGPGGYAARNLGIQEAQAEWVAFLDADDEWYPEHLDKMWKLHMDIPDQRILGCGWKTHDPNGPYELFNLDSYYVNKSHMGNHEISFVDYLVAEEAGMRPIWTSVACIKTDVLLSVGGFPAGKAGRGGDVDTWLRCVELCRGMAWSAHIGAVYYRDSVNMVTRTQLFLAEVERESVRNFLPKYSGTEAKLLKRFANRRTIGAWRQNTHISTERNFVLFGKLYMDVNPVKNICYLCLSLLPPSWFLSLEHFIRQLRILLRSSITTLKSSFLANIALSGYSVIARSVHRKPTYIGKPTKTSVKWLSDGNRPTFFGYHDKTPFSEDGSKILAMSIGTYDDKPCSECTPMMVGYFVVDEYGEFENRFIPVAQTTTWCWQQGCMLQWNPIKADREIIFNTLVNGSYGSQVFDIIEQRKVRDYSYPVYSLSPCGALATTLNFSRLGRLRPGYGYNLLPDMTAEFSSPQDDGLFVFDMVGGEKRLLVSLADLAKEVGDMQSQHYVNHATFSPDSKRLIFFHLWSKNGGQSRKLRVCQVDLVTGVWREVEAERTVSHYCWRDQNTILATTLDKLGIWRYSLYDLVTNSRTDLDLALSRDGHPMFHPLNSNILVTDTYPDRRRDQHLCIVDVATGEIKEIATLYSPSKYSRQVRCDLHPRWDRMGKFVVVDSVAKGTRGLLQISVE